MQSSVDGRQAEEHVACDVEEAEAVLCVFKMLGGLKAEGRERGECPEEAYGKGRVGNRSPAREFGSADWYEHADQEAAQEVDREGAESEIGAEKA